MVSSIALPSLMDAMCLRELGDILGLGGAQTVLPGSGEVGKEVLLSSPPLYLRCSTSMAKA